MCRLNLFLLEHDIWETGDFQFGSRSRFTKSEFVAELRAHGILISMDGVTTSACRSSVSVFSIM